MHHPTTAKGDIGVALVTADLIRHGCIVMAPVSATCPYDLVIEFEGQMYRVQVKYRSIVKGRVEVKPQTASSRFKTVQNKDFDVLAVYCPEINGVAYVAQEDFDKVLSLRVEPSKNNQKKNIILFQDKTQLNQATTNGYRKGTPRDEGTNGLRKKSP